MALTGVDASTSAEEIMGHLITQNLQGEQKEWTEARMKRDFKVLYRRERRHGRSKVVAECSPELRRLLVERGRIYIGWDVVEVTDHLGVTCCSRCQQYGHPEKYCRAKGVVCGKCGEDGHKSEECQCPQTRCATCKKFGRPGAETHRTASRDCPARQHAESRVAAETKYR